MGSEGFNRDLEMVNASCFSPEEPLNTTFLLLEGNISCPRFYGKAEDKKKVYHALKEAIHQEVHAKWGQLKCHCSLIPKMRLSKTARNLNKVFLTCGASATADSRCRYFQWIHTPLFMDRRPIQKLKFATTQTQTEWLQQAEKNVEQWKREQAWLNQFTESARKQQEQREAPKKNQATRGRKPYQVPFIGGQTLPKPTRKQKRGKRLTALPTMSLKPASIVPSRNGARYQPVM